MCVGTDRGPAFLTPREREIACLVSQGRSSRQIAQHLNISERTVDTHIDRIRAKLGFRSRLQIAAWAAAVGLNETAR